MSLLRWLDNIDKTIFVLVHNDSDHAALDGIMLVLRNPLTWIPLYAVLLYYTVRKTGMQAWKFIVLSIIGFAITDSVSASVLKPLFARPRPCHDAALQPFLRNILECGGLYSFPSSHAANHFGLAAFWYWALWIMTGKKWPVLWVWAALICYAQVYTGKHYPSDIAAGALLGYTTGLLMAKIFEYLWNAGAKYEMGALKPEV
ncbi:MAG TPA: phosphatase PAP2 family protein [Chitinophagaceae bacterium]|nr:phosphatase PAP2 family protein [Chitinophagaceae bacterium]